MLLGRGGLVAGMVGDGEPAGRRIAQALEVYAPATQSGFQNVKPRSIALHVAQVQDGVYATCQMVRLGR